MEIEIYSPTNGQPLPAVKWNYPEVKAWLEDGLAAYKGRVYTEDTITQAKKDRANLNKLADAIAAKRREMKATYLHPYEEFDGQAKELERMVKAQSAEIDAQVKAYDNARKEEKRAKIVELYEALIGNLAGLVPYDRLHDPKWLNITTSMTTITEELGRKIDRIAAGLASIDTLGLDADIAQQVKGVFLKDFDLAAALTEKDRIIRQREELARLTAAREAESAAQTAQQGARWYTTAPTENTATALQCGDSGMEKMHVITFRVRVTASQLQGLGDYMKANGIRPERV